MKTIEEKELRQTLKLILLSTSDHLTAHQIHQLAEVGITMLPQNGKKHPKLSYTCNGHTIVYPIPGSGSDGKRGRLNWVSSFIREVEKYAA